MRILPKKLLTIIILTVLTTVASIVICTTCSTSKSGTYSVVYAQASIYGTTVDNSYGNAKARMSEKYPGSCNFCVFDKSYVELCSQKYCVNGFISCGDTTSHYFGVGETGSYTSSYIESWCDGAKTSVRAYLGGYCSYCTATKSKG